MIAGGTSSAATYILTPSVVRRAILLALLCGFCAGAVSLWLLPRTYRAEAKILPSAGGSSPIEDLASSAGLPGVLEIASSRRENPIQTYPEILTGREVLDRTLLRTVLTSRGTTTVLKSMEVRGGTERERVFRGRTKLRKSFSVAANPRTGIISIFVVTRDSVLSASVVSALVDELDRFNVETRRSRGRAVREFVGTRLDRARDDLGQAETALAAFRESNLRIGNSPALQLQQIRLQRDVEIQGDLYRLLSRQYELARIEEYRDTPTFTLLEAATPPFRKYGPRTLVNTTGALIAGLLLALGAEFVRSRFGGGGAHRPRSLEH